jgi:FAD/FMN-containing dehydrogenase
MNRIIEHEPADLIAVTEAGTRLLDFNEALRTKGQWLPLDAPDDGKATIGGAVATGVTGPQQSAYGRPRGSVIGMKVVLSDGSIIKAGGRVVKNVAGYDLCKLFTGSYGTLGVITEVNFKLRPVPEKQATVVAAGEFETLIAAGQSILDARLFPVAALVMSSALAWKIDITTDQCVLLIRFAGNKKAVSYQTENALKLLSETEISAAETIDDDIATWNNIATLPLVKGENTRWRAAVLPAELAGFIRKIQDVLRVSFDDLKWQASVGDGRVRVEHDVVSEEQMQRFSEAANVAGGRLMVERGPQIVQNKPASALDRLTERIKRQLDPHNVLPSMPYR